MYSRRTDSRRTYPQPTDSRPTYPQSTDSQPTDSRPTYSQPSTQPTYSQSTYSQPSTQPTYSQPTYSQPTYSQPTYSQPTYSQSTYSQPTYSQPTYSQPSYSQPTYSQPSYSQPSYSQPSYSQPSIQPSTEQAPRNIPNVQFRVLVIGRANAGKTSILQRVCETTESPTIYRGTEEIKLDPSMNRGEHEIDDELVFSNHKGYIFHDSRGIESGSVEELEILQEFIRRKSREDRLNSRLHAIWYCVPMDNHRPELDLKFYKDICPDDNVPVIVAFTKYDQYLYNVEMDVWDDPDKYEGRDVAEEAEKRFQEEYLRPLGDGARYARLEKMHTEDSRCNELIEKTAAALDENVVALMLSAVQKDNLELSVKIALDRVYSRRGFEAKSTIWECLVPFPYLQVGVECLTIICGTFLMMHDA